MRKGNLSRDQVIELVGLDAVESVENENCDYTNRVQTDGDDSVEFSAIINCVLPVRRGALRLGNVRKCRLAQRSRVAAAQVYNLGLSREKPHRPPLMAVSPLR